MSKTSSISGPVIIVPISSALVRRARDGEVPIASALIRRAREGEAGGLGGEAETLRLVPGGWYQPWCQEPPLPPPFSLRQGTVYGQGDDEGAGSA